MAETKYEYELVGTGDAIGEVRRRVLVRNDCSILKVKRMSDTAILPTRGSERAAGIDLYADIHEPFITIAPFQTKIVGSGIACEFPEGFWGMVVPRSSIGIKRGISLANNVGIIDNDFIGEIKLGLYNHTEHDVIVERGERIAQMILLPYYIYNIVEVNELSDTERGEGGFGSTGK